MGNSELAGPLSRAAKECGSTRTAADVLKERKEAKPGNSGAWKDVVEEIPSPTLKKGGLLNRIKLWQPKAEAKDEEIHSI